MHIALVKRKYSLRSGGSERYCVNLARGLQRSGHEVTVLGEWIDPELRGEVPFVALKTNRTTSWTSNRSFAESAQLAADAGNYDIVYGLGRALGVDLVRVTERLQSHWLQVRYGTSWRGTIQQFNPRHRTLIALERAIYSAPRTRRIVVQSQLDHELLQHYYQIEAERIRVVHNGVDHTAFYPRSDQECRELRQQLRIPLESTVYLFASMDFAGKGLATILTAFADSSPADAHLLVLGEGPVQRFQRQTQRLGCTGQVHFLGRRSDIARFYSASDLFVLPSAYEPFPNVNLESMACGTPVVTSSTAGGADLIEPGRNGFLVQGVNDLEGLNEAFDCFQRTSEDERERMVASCLQTARRRTIDRTVDETLSVFQEVLDDRQAA